MTSINTNTSAMNAVDALEKSQRLMETAMAQLSTGKRINSAADDPTGMALVTRMTGHIRSLDQAVRNAGDATALLQTMDGAATSLTGMLQRMRELALQALNSTVTPEQRKYLNLEFQQLKQEMVRTAESTQWNGLLVLNGTVGEGVGPGLLERVAARGIYHDVAAGGAGTIPGMNTGDVLINDVPVPESVAVDDTRSPAGNAAASAIARAAAINRISDLTGVKAVPGTTVMSGSAMSAASLVGGVSSGTVVINGFASSTITTVQSSALGAAITQDGGALSRAAVVAAINQISDITGVTAVDSGADAGGVRLQAADGRNIEVSIVPAAGTTATEFLERTGLRGGVQTGSYTLEAARGDPLVLARSAGGNLENTGLPLGSFAENRIAVESAARAPALGLADSVPLGEGELVINGVAIRATNVLDDTLSDTTAPGSNPLASATALAAAINAARQYTGVSATALPASSVGTSVNLSTPSAGTYTLFLNGTAVEVAMTVPAPGDDPVQAAATRRAAVVDAVNWGSARTGVRARDNGLGVTLEAIDGRNLSAWYDASVAGLDAASFGLNPDEVRGASIDPASGAVSGTATVYGRVQLQSVVSARAEQAAGGAGGGLFPDGQIRIMAGSGGADGHFGGLGFIEGVYGEKLAPPVTRMQFQIGSEENQTLNVEVPDFGKHGTVTSLITGDMDAAQPTVGIDSVDGANAVLGLIDETVLHIGQVQTKLGSAVNRLQEIIDNLNTTTVNVKDSRSRIEDTDYNQASADLARAQIIRQAATAVLAQANASQQSVLKLLNA